MPGGRKNRDPAEARDLAGIIPQSASPGDQFPLKILDFIRETGKEVMGDG
jgi:hypothetical protein